MAEKIEREYVIPLRREWMKVPYYERAKKATKAIKEFLARHMKIYDRDLRKIKIDKYLNEEMWHRGIRNAPSKIKVKAVKEGDIVRVELSDLPERLKFKKAREERISKKLEESAKTKKEEHKHEGHEHHGEESEEKKIETEEKKAATVEGMEKLEKETAKKSKHQESAKPDKVQRLRKSLKSR